MSATTRRDLLTGAAASLGAFIPIGALIPPRIAAAQADTTLRALDDHRQRLEGEANTHVPGLTDEQSDARVDALAARLTDVEDEIVEQPAGTVYGLLVKLRILAQIRMPSEEHIDGRLLLAALDDAERLAAEGSA